MRIPTVQASTAFSGLARLFIFCVLIGVLAIVGGFYFIGPIVIGHGGSAWGLAYYLLGSLAVWHHTLLFMAALWFLQLAFARLGRADTADPRLERNLARSGLCLIAGAFAWAITRPVALHSAWFEQLLREQNLQFSIETSLLPDNFVAAAVIGLLGTLLLLASKVLRERAAATTELQQIF